MPIPVEVRKTIAAIDQKIKDLEETKKRLLETFGGSLVTVKPNGNRPQDGGSRTIGDAMNDASSADKLVAFLRAHGPATRREIYDLSGVPSGSVSYLLKSGKFRMRPEERW